MYILILDIRFLYRLRVRDEEFLRLQNEYYKVEQNVGALHGQVKMEQEKYKNLEDVNKQIAEERDEFKDR
jgi:hypothetical protein